MAKNFTTEIDELRPWFSPSKRTGVALYVDPQKNNIAAGVLSASVVQIPAELRLEQAPESTSEVEKVLSLVRAEESDPSRWDVRIARRGGGFDVVGEVKSNPEDPDQRLQFAREIRDVVAAASGARAPEKAQVFTSKREALAEATRVANRHGVEVVVSAASGKHESGAPQAPESKRAGKLPKGAGSR
jgi:hypothetical protein